MSSHLKRLASPRSWPVLRKTTTFVTKPNPGTHSLEECIPLNVLVKDVLGLADSTREVKKLLKLNNVFVDGVRRMDIKFPVGIMDTVTIRETGKHYRVIVNKKGKIALTEISKDESDIKPCKIVNKSLMKGKIQLNLSDGRNILVEKDGYKTGDTLILKLPEQAIEEHIKIGKDVVVFLTKGKHIGETGVVTDISGRRTKYKTDKGDVVETSTDYVLVIGKDKPAIKVD